MATKKKTTKKSEHSAVDKFSESAHDAIDQFTESAEPAEERVRHAAKEAQERFSHSADRARTRSVDLIQEVSDTVCENPIAAIGIAAAAGFVLSKIFSR